MPPGSGSIVGRVYADGLTRVLRLEDEAEAKRNSQPMDVREMLSGFGSGDVISHHNVNAVTKITVSSF